MAYRGYEGCSGDRKCQSNDLEVSGRDMRAGVLRVLIIHRT